MSDLGSNPLWSNISNKSSTVKTDILGPDYSYGDNLVGPSAQGIGSDGTFSQLGRNAEGIAYYVGQLITGNPPLGNQFFVNTGGSCTASDGSKRPRYNYINNMSSGKASLPAAFSEIGSDFNGLIPGVVDDIEGLDPTYIFSSMISDGTPSCNCYQCPVTGAGNQYRFMTPELSPDLASSSCTQVDISNCIQTEGFEVSMSAFKKISVLIAILGIIYFNIKK